MKYWPFFLLVFILGFVAVLPAYAYIDPGTTGSLFNAFSSILPMLLAFLGFLFLPLKRFIKFLVGKLKGEKRKPENKQEGRN